MPYTDLVRCPSRDEMNTGLSPARHGTMLSVLGRPGKLTGDCSSITNAALRAKMELMSVGPFRVEGHRTAVASLAHVFAEIKAHHPDLYPLIGTAGMLCCRAVRGSDSYFSNHSWGTAIDLKIGGVLPGFNARMIPRGLLVIYPYFHQHGWFWAAGYNGRTDPMHFEVADETVRGWR